MEWFESWFDTPYYHLLYNNRDYTEAENFIQALTNELQLPKNSTIIDLACGKGRHSVFLNKLGYNVLGLDLSAQSIAHNKQFETSPNDNPSLKFAIHDMRNNIDSEPVDAVFNLFTSFGYFDDEKEDQKEFDSFSKVLKFGGLFVLDFMNQQWVKNTLVEKTDTKRGDLTFHISKKIENQFIIKDIDFEDEGKSFHFFEKVKLHTIEKIEAYAEKAGFERLNIWGNYQLEKFNDNDSPRCIILFRKK